MEVLSKPFVLSAKPYPYVIEETQNGRMIRLKELLSAIVQDIRANKSVGMIGARFHRTVSEIAIDICKCARETTGLNEIALSGGVWQNQILLDLVRAGLRQEDFLVYSHQQVPSNDGGLALGQAVIANFEISNRKAHEERDERLLKS